MAVFVEPDVLLIDDILSVGDKGSQERCIDKILSLKDDKKTIGNFLNDCTIIDIYTRIKTYTLDIKQKQKVKLPDAIIAATALFLDIPLITADKGFKKIKGIKLNLFEVSS